MDRDLDNKSNSIIKRQDMQLQHSNQPGLRTVAEEAEDEPECLNVINDKASTRQLEEDNNYDEYYDDDYEDISSKTSNISI